MCASPRPRSPARVGPGAHVSASEHVIDIQTPTGSSSRSGDATALGRHHARRAADSAHARSLIGPIIPTAGAAQICARSTHRARAPPRLVTTARTDAARPRARVRRALLAHQRKGKRSQPNSTTCHPCPPRTSTTSTRRRRRSAPRRSGRPTDQEGEDAVEPQPPRPLHLQPLRDEPRRLQLRADAADRQRERPRRERRPRRRSTAQPRRQPARRRAGEQGARVQGEGAEAGRGPPEPARVLYTQNQEAQVKPRKFLA